MLNDELVDRLRRWIRLPQGAHCVSIYMPVDPIGPRVRANAIRLKNLLRHAEQLLAQRGATTDLIDRILDPARLLVRDQETWKHSRQGLALLLRVDETLRYDSPKPFTESVHVDLVPHIKPLFRDHVPDERFHVLTLSRDDVALWAGDAETLERVTTDAIPRRIEDALGEEVEIPSLQQRSVRMGLGQSGKSAVFHGHGVGIDEIPDEMMRFFRHVDRGVLETLREHTLPLVLAGVERNVGIYRGVTRYPSITAAHIEGDPAGLLRDGLHAKAWPIVLPYLRAPELQARRRFHELSGTSRASSDLAEVLSAAEDGRIETLFAGIDDELFGHFDAMTRSMAIDGGADAVDLVELAVSRALVHDAEVYTAPRSLVPGGGLVAATYRF
jgi:hypothetical protein